MRRLFLLLIISTCSTYCFSQSNEVDHLRGNITISPKIFSRNNITKEVIFSVNMDKANKDSFMYKTKLYDTAGNITKEIYPFLMGTSNTIFTYNTHNKIIKESSPDRPSEDVEYVYDPSDNLIAYYKKSNGKIMADTRYKYNGRQLIKKTDMVGDSDITRTEQYQYNKNGKIDSAIVIQSSLKYTEHYVNSNNTFIVSYATKDLSGTDSAIYNNSNQLIKTVKIEKTPTYLTQVSIIFTYNIDGTLQQENVTSIMQEGAFLSQQHTLYNHYYLQ